MTERKFRNKRLAYCSVLLEARFLWALWTSCFSLPV